jgi:hypothetical protein
MMNFFFCKKIFYRNIIMHFQFLWDDIMMNFDAFYRVDEFVSGVWGSN